MESDQLYIAPKLVDFDCCISKESINVNDSEKQQCHLTLKVENNNQNSNKYKEYEVSIDSAMLNLMTQSFEKLRDQLSNIASKS